MSEEAETNEDGFKASYEQGNERLSRIAHLRDCGFITVEEYAVREKVIKDIIVLTQTAKGE